MIAPEGFELGEELSRDSTGILFAATQTRLSRTVTLKILRPEFADHAKAKAIFLAERELVTGLENPNLLLTIDVGELDGRPWFVTESMSEPRLESCMDGMQELRAVRMALGLAQALHYLAQRGLIYKNVCPKNVLLPRPNAPKLITFRHVRRAEEAMSFQGANVQSGRYCAPELTRTDLGPVTSKVNTYAVGAILYELLADQPLLDGDSAAARAAHAAGDIPPLKTVRGFLRDRAYSVVSRLMAHDPHQRCDSAAAVALLEAYANDPLVANPLQSTRKKRKRRR